MKQKKLFCTIFFLLLFIPMLFGIITKWTDLKVDVPLYNAGAGAKPDFSLQSFISGDFQTRYEDWFRKSYAGRSIVIKTYNQLRFSLFHLSTQNTVVGENNDLFQSEYIEEYLGLDSRYDFSDPDRRENLEAYVDKLAEISQMLSKQGKTFLFWLTPAKCDYNFADIPDHYLAQSPQEYVRGVDILRDLLEEKNVPYIDSYDIISQTDWECPIFYKSGIHWSRPVEQEVSRQVLERIEELRGQNVKKFQFVDLKKVEEGYRDRDLWNLMNIWEEPEETHYEYTTEPIVSEGDADIHLLLQGGSFAEGAWEDFTRNNICSDIHYIVYNQHVVEMDGTKNEISYGNDTFLVDSDWSNLDLGSMVEESNVILVEANAKHLFAFSNGFLDLLYDYLKETEGV